MADLGSIDIGGGRSGLRFAISIPGAQGFAVALSRFGDDISDFTAFWEGKFKTFWYALRQLDYASAGGATGPMWAPLSPDYRRWKNAHFPSAPLLVLQGSMKASLLSPTASGSIWRPSATRLEAGSSIPHAIYHQTGTSRMPARPPLRFAEQDRIRIGKLLQEFAADAWKKRRQAERSAA